MAAAPTAMERTQKLEAGRPSPFWRRSPPASPDQQGETGRDRFDILEGLIKTAGRGRPPRRAPAHGKKFPFRAGSTGPGNGPEPRHHAGPQGGNGGTGAMPWTRAGVFPAVLGPE